MNKFMTRQLFQSRAYQWLLTTYNGSAKPLFNIYFLKHKKTESSKFFLNLNQGVVVFTFISLQSLITVFSGKVTALHSQWDTILPLNCSRFIMAILNKMPLGILLIVKQHLLPAPAHRISFITRNTATNPFRR